MVEKICAPEKAEPALFQHEASNLLHYLHLKAPSWERVEGTQRLGLEQEKLGGDWHGMSVRTQLRVPVGSQDGVCIGALPLGVAPVTPLNGACLLFLELLTVFPKDLHCVVLGYGGLGVLRPLEESQL